MKQQPDKLFQEKLFNHIRTAPTAAWEKIESKLEKKSSGFFWYKIAASILLICTAAVLIFKHDVRPLSPSIAEVNTNSSSPATIGNTRPQEPSLQEPEIEKSTWINKDTEVLNSVSQTTRQEPKRKVASKDKLLHFTADIVVPAPPVNNEVVSVTGELIHQPVPVILISSIPTQTSNSVTLVMSTKETDEYLLDKSRAEATTAHKKTSGVKRLWKKASDLKTNQDPFADLRQKKNEIFALNFISDKKRDQKR